MNEQNNLNGVNPMPQTPVTPVQPEVTPTPVAPVQPVVTPVEPVPQAPVEPVPQAQVNPVPQASVNPVPQAPVQPGFTGAPVTPMATPAGGSKPFSINNINWNDKKVVGGIIGVIIAIILLIVLFGGKTLTCTDETESFGVTTKYTYTVKYGLGKAKEVSMKVVLDYSDYEYDFDIEEIRDGMEESLKDSDEYKSYKVTAKGDVITAVVKYDLKRLADEEDLEIESYKEAKEYFEDEEMTCK